MGMVSSGKRVPSNLQLSRLVKAPYQFLTSFVRELNMNCLYITVLVKQAGPRICLGKEFAYRQMKIFSAVLLRYFAFKLSDDKKTVNYRTMINLHIDGGLHVRFFHR